ncbi:MAG: phage GP46 family protein [Filomicrobium sp.]
MTRFTDLYVEQDSEGIFDLVIDEDERDFELTDGLDSAIIVSLFSDRRAYADEVQDPWKRRGWIGDLVSEEPNDRHGSGLWLYEQRRLTQDTAIGVRNEAVQSLEWMQDEALVTQVEADVLSYPEHRRVDLRITLQLLDGGVVQRAYALADATRTGILYGSGRSN